VLAHSPVITPRLFFALSSFDESKTLSRQRLMTWKPVRDVYMCTFTAQTGRGSGMGRPVKGYSKECIMEDITAVRAIYRVHLHDSSLKAPTSPEPYLYNARQMARSEAIRLVPPGSSMVVHVHNMHCGPYICTACS
jgi:hypothetical protein